MNWLNGKEDTAENRVKKEKARLVLVDGGYMSELCYLVRNDEQLKGTLE
jgi:hypothetical protein